MFVFSHDDSNCLVSRDLVVKISDFGMSRELQQSGMLADTNNDITHPMQTTTARVDSCFYPFGSLCP